MPHGHFRMPDKGVTLPPEETPAAGTEPQGTDTTTAPAASQAPATDEPAFPANTPVAEMTTAQQAAYWKAQSRKHENRAKNLGSPEEIKKLRDDAAELDKLRQASMGEQEKAVATAKAEERAATAREFSLRLVAAEFRAATAGRIERDDLDAALEPMDLGKFLTDTGEVDTEKVTSYAERIAPGGRKDGKTPFPDLGQGRRTTTATPSVTSGRAAYAARKGQAKPTAITSTNA